MVIQSYKKFELNCKITGRVSGVDMEWHDSTFIVIREASLDELKQQIKDLNAIDTGDYAPFIYEVQVD